MSTILKALRRLEEEKAAAEEPRPLREQIASSPRGAQRPRRGGWLAAGGALVLGVATGGALIWWLFGNPTPAPVVAAAAPVAPAPPPPVPVVAASAPAAAPGPPEQAFASDVEIVDRPEALPLVADSDPVHLGPIEPKPGSVRPVQSSAAAERARQAALAEYNAAERARLGLAPEIAAPSPPAPAEPVPILPAQTVAAQAMTPAPEAVPAPVAPPELPTPARVAQAPAREVAAAQPTPKVAAADPAPKAAPPKPAAANPAARKPAPEPAPPPAPPAAPEIAVSVEKTQWHPLADRRIAWLRVPGDPEPRRVVEGDVVDGLLIAHIEPSGVVFERDGEKIRRPLGR